MGKDEEEREKVQHAKDRIDEYVAKQGEEHIYHKQEGKNNKGGVEQTVHMFIHLKNYRASHPSEERHGSAGTFLRVARADADFES